MHDLTLTLVQASPAWEDIPANLAYYSRLLEGTGNTDLVILPEMFNTGFSTQPAPIAESMNGPTVSWMARQSKQLGAAVGGSLIISEEGRYYNRFVFATPEGGLHTYDKRHLFSMAGEDRTFAKGTKRLVVPFRGWNISPQVCYDLRFPAWSRNSWKDGKYAYDLLVYVASWPEVRQHAWKSLLPARAIENLSYVAAVSRFGTDGNNIAHAGDSMVLDFLGQPVITFEPHRELVKSIALSGKALLDFRARFNVGPDWDRVSI